MGELRLYAIGIDEVRGVFGAGPQEQERLRGIASQLLAPTVASGGRGGLLTKLGPIFKRPPGAAVVSPTQPVPQDLDVLLAGAYVPPDRLGASWRLLETLVQGTAWSSTLMNLTPESLDELDFALASGGVSAAAGLRHLLNSPSSVPLLPVHGLTVGCHPHAKALAMAAAYRSAVPQVKTREQAELVAALVTWLDGFHVWAHEAVRAQRPVPDLVGFWAN
ncbi:MAG TPA: hypothetical protein VEQ66_00995 [Propionibacteriaceae bacterium]|nr:hypothetical protein [Propionibacteriaceae bacterium]